MTTDDIRRLQTHIGATSDGIFGRGTWTAVFTKLGAGPVRARELGMAAVVHIPQYQIWTPLRLAHYLAQLAHESGGFVYMEEIASGAAYEGRKDLGNTEPGDGKRFKGRGPIQLTGRANYRHYGQKIGIDLENHPEIAAVPSIGLLTSCLYWFEKGLNNHADRDDVEAITRRINGGVNGLDDRKKRLKVTKGMLL